MLALNIFSSTQGKSPEETEKIIKEYLDVRNHTLLDDHKTIQFSYTSD
jgi:hypothetical protein